MKKKNEELRRTVPGVWCTIHAGESPVGAHHGADINPPGNQTIIMVQISIRPATRPS
jgi:hypothetical protein